MPFVARGQRSARPGPVVRGSVRVMASALPFDLPIERVSFVSLDLETTGLAPGCDRITEIGAARFNVRRCGTIVPGPTLQTLVNPGRMIPVPVVRLTGITDEMVADATPLEEAWLQLHAFLTSDEPTVLLAHNARFDLAFLVAAAYLLKMRWTGPPAVCTMRIARRALPDAPRYALEPLVRWLTCNGHGAAFHRALADALHARNLFSGCVARTEARTLRELGVSQALELPRPSDFEVDVPARLDPLQGCIDSQTRVQLVYRGGSKGRGERPITPLAFYMADGVLYLRGWCHIDDVAKSFRCDRIGHLGLGA